MRGWKNTLKQFPGLTTDRDYVLRLIAKEFELRRRREASLKPDEYLRRFPAYREALLGAGPEEPLVCIPLSVGDKTIGAIALYRMLVQKERFTALDHELFTLLGGHAATAILAAQLHAQSARKLNTMQGLIGLLTQK